MDLVFDDQRYGCTCDSETVIFCFDKRTGSYEWSCSGQCFQQVPKESVATQTEITAHFSSVMRRTSQRTSTLTQSKTRATETIDETELASLISNAIVVLEEKLESGVGSSNATSGADQVISCDVHSLNPSFDDLDNIEDKTLDNAEGNCSGDNNDVHDGAGTDSDSDMDTRVDATAADDYDAEDQTSAAQLDSDNDKDNEGGEFDGGHSDSDMDTRVDATAADDYDAEDQTSAAQLYSDNDKDNEVDGGHSDSDMDTCVDATTPDDGDDDDDAEHQTSATQFDSNDGKDDEGGESDIDILNSPLKVKVPRSRKEKAKGSTPREAFPCTYCSRICKTKSMHEKHIAWHTRSKETKCSICGKEFSQPGYLINHQKKHQQAREHEEEASEGTDNLIKNWAECRHCGKLVRRRRLEGHERTHTKQGQKRTRECSYCGKTSFKGPSEFACHVRTHTKEKPYKCDRCESAFSSNKHLTIHIRRHLGDKRYKCDHCGKAFVRKCNLDEHLRTHTGARPYKCDYCDKSFGFKNVLKVHLVRHTGIRPHVCEYCNKGFAKKAFLDKHLLSHA